MNRTPRHLALVATSTVAAAIGLAATSHADDTSYTNFLSPSGNINCSIMLLPPFPLNGVEQKGNNTVDCQLADYTWQPPGGVCASGVVESGFRADAVTPPNVDCAKYPNQVPLPWPTLDYGQTASLGVITCDSEPRA